MSLLLHCNAFAATYNDLCNVPNPALTRTYEPILHGEIVDAVKNEAKHVGLEIKQTNYGLSKSGSRLFAVIDFAHSSLPNYSWSVGFRNSYDKSMSASICAGARVFVCDNMVFSGNISFTTRHIPRNGFSDYIQEAFADLPQEMEKFQLNLESLKGEDLTDDQARLLVFTAAEKKIIASSEVVPIWNEYCHPAYDEFIGANKFNLLMAFTEKAKSYNSIVKSERLHRSVGNLFAV